MKNDVFGKGSIIYEYKGFDSLKSNWPITSLEYIFHPRIVCMLGLKETLEAICSNLAF